MNFQEIYERYADQLPDFWGRRAALRFACEEHVFGLPYRLQTDYEPLLAVAEHSRSYFSRAPVLDRPPIQIQIVVAPVSGGAVAPPDSLFQSNSYSGRGEWLLIHLGHWGHAYADLAAGHAVIAVDPSLVERPHLIAHSVLNTILINFCLYRGFGMLHGACLVRDDSALLLVADHNSGKSTTALRLALSGFELLTDSMVHLSPLHEDQLLCGFPIGRIKLRKDMLPHFPELGAHLRPELVRNETKYSVDLREFNSTLQRECALNARRVIICFLSRHGQEQTEFAPIGRKTMWETIMANSLFYDSEEVWQRNLEQIEPLVARATAYDLRIGHDPIALVEAVERLWSLA